MNEINHPWPSEVVLVESRWSRLGLTIQRRWSCCGHGAKVVKTIVELHGIYHHRRCQLGRRNVVGALVGSCMLAKAPAAGGSGGPRSIVAEWH